LFEYAFQNVSGRVKFVFEWNRNQPPFAAEMLMFVLFVVSFGSV